MKIIGVIPSRYSATRFPGKPLADICGKPMIWWVYHQAKQAKMLDEIYVATDDERIKNVCEENGVKVIMTDSAIPTPTDRVYTVSTMVDSDLYLVINGDEPLINPEAIDKIAKEAVAHPDYDVVHAVAKITSSAEVVDYSNLKTVATENGDAVYISRSPVPYPKGTLDFEYRKLVCIYTFTKDSLKFFNDTPKGAVEKCEECDIIRFIENRKKVLFVEADDTSLSVDTPKDLDKVREVMQGRLDSGEVQID